MIDKLNKVFEKDQVLHADELNSMTSKIDEIIDPVNNSVPEAPKDDKSYVRSNGSWEVLQKIEYIEGTSDKDGWITNEIAPEGSLIISRMYLHPTLNMWCHCPSYETATDGDKIITGGVKYGVAVVVGGTEAQTFPNCKYRVYFIRTTI